MSADLPPRLTARILAALFAAGATLAAVTLILPHSERAQELGLLAVVGTAYLCAIGLWRVESPPEWLLPSALAWGTISITAVAWFSGEAPSPLIFFYLWIFLYSAYFFDRKLALAEIGWAGITYAALLLAGPATDAPSAAWWIVGMGSLLVGALVVSLMRDQVELLIGRLFESARRDPLTQLTNRRGFRELFDLELERARRNQSSMSLLLGDIDHFKSVNDLAGHHAGDRLLRRLAEVLAEHKGSAPSLARIGGEEFGLLLSDTDADRALEVAERIREGVQRTFADEAVPITISFGVAAFPAHGDTSAGLLRAGDDALYVAKESGRNRCVTYHREHEVPGTRGGGRRASTEEAISAERFISVMLDLAETVDMRFSGSARHSETVGRYAEMMARELGFNDHMVGRIRLAGMLHDIGKATISDAILHKPGALTDSEFERIKTHPGLGSEILEHPSLADVRAWVGSHHERPDGRGYPVGLAAAEISTEAQIVAVADAYEAMTSVRSYKVSIGPRAALAELRACAGTQFDGEVVEALARTLCLEPGGEVGDQPPPELHAPDLTGEELDLRRDTSTAVA